MTTVQIQISDQQAAAIEADAQAHGLTVEQWFLQPAERAAPLPSEPPTVEDDPTDSSHKRALELTSKFGH